MINIPPDFKKSWNCEMTQHFLTLVCLFHVLAFAFCKELVSLEGANFELTLASNKYVIVLFYDQSSKGDELKKVWSKVGDIVDIHTDAEIAQIDGNDPDLTEIIELYDISIPSVKVFRRGVMAYYQGPSLLGNSREGDIAKFIEQDSLPSVKLLRSFDDVKRLLKTDQNAANSMVLGLFEEDVLEESDEGEDYSVSPWGQYQATADALRGHAVFYVITDKAARAGFNIEDDSQLPVIYVVTGSKESLVQYKGEILERNLSEWLLRLSSPDLGELTLADGTGELFATQFFNSRKLKFILFVDPESILNSAISLDDGTLDLEGLEKEAQDGDIIAGWAVVAQKYKDNAIFSYMARGSIQDVNDYFGVGDHAKLPIIGAHDPSRDQRYRSGSGELDSTVHLHTYVEGVLLGEIEKITRSEAVPLVPKGLSVKEQEKERAKPVKLVGSNVVHEIVSSKKDVLLLVHQGNKGYYKFRAEYEILARACAAEDRVVIAHIDLAKNDIPSLWESSVKSGSDWGILWFPAKSRKVSEKVPSPKPYWAAGYTLPELVWFVQREGSFELSSLKVATSEQLNMLLDDLETLQMTYLEEQRWEGLNDNRPVFEDPWVDWLMGELVFEGKRWHIIAVAMCFIASAVQIIYSFFANSKTEVTAEKKMTKKIILEKKKN